MSTSDAASYEFADYNEVLRRRWTLVVVGLVVGIALAAIALHFVPKTYTSTASVIVQSTGETTSVENGRTSTDINLDTEAQIVTSTVVATLAQGQLKVTTAPRELAKKVAVTVPPNTSVLDISFSAPTAKKAQGGAHAFADSYLRNRKSLADDRVSSQTKVLQSKIDGLAAQLRASGRKIAALPASSSERTYETSQRDLLIQQIAALNTQLAPLTSGDITPGDIITDAQLPVGPSNPNAKLLITSGLLAGLLAGVLLALAVDRTDKRVRDRRDLERLGLDALVGRVSVPAVREGGVGRVTGTSAESLRQLRNALLTQMPVKGGSVLVAAASDGPGGSALAVSLAATIARSGASVILVSANSESCSVVEAFDTPKRPGLADLLKDRASVEDAVFDVEHIANLKVVAAGSDGSLYSDLLQVAAVQTVFDSLRKQADYVVIDVAPITVNADAQTLATVSGGVLLVATELRTTREDVIEAVDQLRHVSASMLGAVVVSVKRERDISPSGMATTSADRSMQGEDAESANEDLGPEHDANEESSELSGEQGEQSAPDGRQPHSGTLLKLDPSMSDELDDQEHEREVAPPSAAH